MSSHSLLKDNLAGNRICSWQLFFSQLFKYFFLLRFCCYCRNSVWKLHSILILVQDFFFIFGFLQFREREGGNIHSNHCCFGLLDLHVVSDTNSGAFSVINASDLCSALPVTHPAPGLKPYCLDSLFHFF